MKNKNLYKEFQKYVGRNNIYDQETDLYAYSYDAAVLDRVLPEIVLRPENPKALSNCIKLCSENEMPVTVRGSGTNLSGCTIPDKNGAVILTTGLNRICEINEEDMYAIVEPGVITLQFANAVESKGLFYPPDPGSQAVSTLGGNVSQNAGGLRGLKYGVTKDYVMGLEFFSSEGDLIKTGSKTVKCVTGYNLTGLLTGAEGTLGVYSKIILKLIPIPESKKAVLAVFDSVRNASESVAAIIANKIVPATLEFMDNFTIRAVETFSKVGLPVDAEAVLLIETDGHPVVVEEELQKIEKICNQNGAVSIKKAESDEERNNIWEARRSALSALAKLKPTVVLEDATVPRSKIPDMIEVLTDIAKQNDIAIGTFGHAGDGNLHPTILTDRRDEKEWKKVEKIIETIFDKALDLGGTLSGEHGIGIAKSGFLEKEIGRSSIEYSRKIKKSIDPKNILNPGKFI